MKTKMELATCIVCKRPFYRCAKGRRRPVCGDLKCDKIRRLGKDVPVSLSSISNHAPNFQWVQGQYNGGYTE